MRTIFKAHLIVRRVFQSRSFRRRSTSFKNRSPAKVCLCCAKRHAQSVIGELQAKYKAWEKSQKSAGGSIDIPSVAADLLSKGNIVVAPIDGASDDQLRTLIDSIKKRSPSFAAMLAATDGQKVSFVAAVSDDLIAKGLKAGDWVRETAKVAGGGGGGRPQMAQAGGKDPGKLGEALEVARTYASKLVG